MLHVARFGEAMDYTYAYGMDGVSISNAGNTKLEGKNLLGTTSPDGRKIFAELIEGVKKNDKGVIIYLWPRPGQSDAVRKMAYYEGVPGLDLFLGTSVYIDDLDEEFRTQAIRTALITGLALLVALLITIAISISITRPLNSSASRMRRLADGHLDEEIKEMARTDEIGRMAATVHVFKRNTLEMRRLEQEEAKARAEAERSQTLLALASSLESKVKHVADELNGAPQVMEARARAMTDKSAKAGERVAHAAEAEKSSTTSVQTVASAAEELVSSINEIGQQASHSAGLTERAVGEANEAFSSRPTEVGLVGDRHTEVGPLARRKPGRAGARRVGLGEAKGQREPRSALVRTPSDTCVSYCA